MNFARTLFLFVLTSSSISLLGSETPSKGILKRSGSLPVSSLAILEPAEPNSVESRGLLSAIASLQATPQTCSSEASPRSLLSVRKNNEAAAGNVGSSRSKQTESSEVSPSSSPSRRNVLLGEIKAGLSQLEEIEIAQQSNFITHLQKKLTELQEEAYKSFLLECKRKAEEKAEKDEADKKARKEYERATLWYDFPSGSGNKVCSIAELRKEEKAYYKSFKHLPAATSCDCP